MEVLLEPIAGGFRASTGKPLDITVEGNTAGEVLDSLRFLVARRLQGGGKIVEIDIPDTETHPENPWLASAGVFKDDPLFDEWQANIAEYRRERDAEETQQ